MQTLGTLLGLVAIVLIVTGIIGNRKRKKNGEKKNKQTWIGIAVFVLAFIVTPVSPNEEANAEPKDDSTEETKKEEVNEEDVTEEETTEEATEEEDNTEEVVEETESEPSIEERINAIADDAFSGVDEVSYNEDNNFVLFRVQGPDNLTINMTRKSWYIAQLDTLESLEGVEGIDTVDFNILTTLVDQYGNEKDEIAMTSSFTADTREKINFDNVLFDNLPNIADEYWHHPAMEK
ncbi:hypothetical protein [Alkalicoccobacillus porphyridii]|uniref:Uncharacterized protein n=1 Tax=Alkalicoccobacillus porphyridii TaxID=2597270 RepID=A0A554A3A6_9BACI|nr:hypothetical protein [Alkalicoccobacillus porphyridii]TSB48174.1 hypothetical protein FN960_01055 [Alkalicoccobacillus porphyridii]